MAAAEKKLITYTWTGLDKNKRKSNGIIDAVNANVARAMLRKKGIAVKNIKKKPKPLFGGKNKVQVKDIVFVSRQIATMLQSGIPIASTLRGIASGNENKGVSSLLSKVSSDIETGSSLSESIQKHPKHFNKFYTNLVSVGEQSGTLDNMMVKIASYLEKMEGIKKKIKSAMFYPAMVLAVAIIVVTVLLVFVIPEFDALFKNFGAELPALTRWIVNLSNIFRDNYLYVLAAIIIFIVVFKFAYRRSAKLRFAMDRLVLKMPVFGKLLRKAIIARVTRTLSTMFGAGIPLVEALDTVADAAGNRVYESSIRDIKAQVSAGSTLEHAMTNTQDYEGMVLQMVATGEESGDLEGMLNKVAEFYEEDVDNAIAVMSQLIEPFLIVFLGVIVGTIVVAMYMPIFQLGSVI